MDIPTAAELERGYKAFQKRERRDAMYKTATFLVDHFWAQPAEMADSLGVLLLTWNQAFYRYGSFDFSKLEKCIEENFQLLEGYRVRTVLDHSAQDAPPIRKLFLSFLAALAIADGSGKGRQSPVAVAKTLHLLAPRYFPLWDKAIALAYGCDYARQPAEQYIAFVRIAQTMALSLRAVVAPKGKTLLKIIDEYNYAVFTKRWA